MSQQIYVVITNGGQLHPIAYSNLADATEAEKSLNGPPRISQADMDIVEWDRRYIVTPLTINHPF